MRKLHGNEDPIVARGLNNLGLALVEKGDYAAAEQLLREALAMYRRLHGNEHVGTLISTNNLARSIAYQGKLDAAAALFQEAVTKADSVLPSEDISNGVFKGYYGECLTRMQRYDDAEQQLIESYETLSAVHPPVDERVGKVISFLITLYEAWDAAEPGKGYGEKVAEWRVRLPPRVDESDVEEP